jgi:hypothetical protein
MAFTASCHLFHKDLLILCVKSKLGGFNAMLLEEGGTWHFLRIFRRHNRSQNEIDVQVWINVTKEGAFDKVYCLHQF